MLLSHEELLPISKAIFHSEDGPGYYVFRNFIPSEYAEHIVRFHTDVLVPSEWYKQFFSNSQFYVGCPNYYQINNDIWRFYNFLWNDPPDELNHDIAFHIQILRNMVESRVAYREIFPTPDRSVGRKGVSYRVTITKKGSWVPPHTDLMDPERIQATLFLTKKDQDYEGDGFIFITNQGGEIAMADELSLNPGDLVFWRYANEHYVENVVAKQGRAGFARIIYTPETIYSGPHLSWAGIRDRVLSPIKRNSLAQKYLKPIYWKYLTKK